MTDFIMPNNISCLKYAQKSVPGLADVGVLHGDGDSPELHLDIWGGSGKSFK